MAGATLILGLGTSPAMALMPLGLAALTLVATGVVRDLEIRVRLSLRRVYFAGTPDSLRELRDGTRPQPGGDPGRDQRRTHPADLGGAGAGRQDVARDGDGVDRDAARTPAIVAAASTLAGDGIRVRDLLTYYESEFKKVPLTELTPGWFLFDRDDRRA